jgi:hypothetical protein
MVKGGNHQVDNLQIVPTDGVTRVSADVDGYEVWFNVPGDFDPNRVGNAFLATVFFPAMAQGGELRFGDGFRLSRQLLNELPTLQKTFGAWSKNLQSFTVAPTPTTVVNASEQVGSLFSGSIDSICTLLQHSDEITDLVHIAGFEFAPAASGAPDPVDALRAMADKYKKPMRVLETNALKFAYEQKIARDLYHGSLMAAASHILGCKKPTFPPAPTTPRYSPGVHTRSPTLRGVRRTSSSSTMALRCGASTRSTSCEITKASSKTLWFAGSARTRIAVGVTSAYVP